MNRKTLLFALIVLLLGAVIYAFLASPRQKLVPSLPVKPEPITAGGKESIRDVDSWPRLRLDLLARSKEALPRVNRDIFGPIWPADDPVPASQSSAAPSAPLPSPEISSTPSVFVTPFPPPVILRKESSELKYLGFMKKDDLQTVFLSFGEEIFLVKKGGRFGDRNQFLVSDLSSEQLVIRQNETESLIIVPLVEQQETHGRPSLGFFGAGTASLSKNREPGLQSWREEMAPEMEIEEFIMTEGVSE